MGDQHRLAQPGGDRRGSVADMDHKQLDLRHVGDDAEPCGLGGADYADPIRAIVRLDVALGSMQPVV
jgi:hypothetical protein